MKYLLSILTLLLIATACNQERQQITSADQIATDISAYTSGVISTTDDIQVRLAAALGEGKVGKDLTKGTISLQPKASGRAYWSDAYTITYRPSEALSYGEVYEVTVDLGKLKEDGEKSSFTVTVRPLTFTHSVQSTKYDRDNVQIVGEVGSSEPVETVVVEELLVAKTASGKKLQLDWNHYSETKHQYVIKGVQKGESQSHVQLTWDGGSLDRVFRGSKKIDIVGKGSFAVTGYQPQTDGSSVIKVSFSDMIKTPQNVDGLVSISGQNSVKVDIDGSFLLVYPSKPISGAFTLTIDRSLERYDGKELGKEYVSEMSFEPTLPMLAESGKGVIVPHSDAVIYPFKAKNLTGVTVEVFKVFEDNVLQMLQYNAIDDNYNLSAVGRIVHQEHVDLTSLSTDDNSTAYVRYALDLSKFTKLDPGAIYQVRIGFSKQDVRFYPCSQSTEVASAMADRDKFVTIMKDDYGRGYIYGERDNPCHASYYTRRRFLSRNVLASNLGLISKVDPSHHATTTASDLRDVSPLSGVELEYYDFQQQLIAKAKTTKRGISNTDLSRRPAFVIAKYGGDYGYLSLQDRNANETSEFDVAGKKKTAGLDGFIYGERGVWRPGDTIYLDVMLEDKSGSLPIGHPVKMQVYDARGKERYQDITTSHVGHIYHFSVPTEYDAITGSWRAVVTVGNKTFQQSLKVETVKPNRIKIDYDKDELDLSASEKIILTAAWLHGSPAATLDATVDMTLRPAKTTFDNYRTYTFDDPARRWDATPSQVYKGKLTAEGKATVELEKNNSWLPPGKMTATLQTKVTEKGGNINTDTYVVPADPYDRYVGVRIPKDRWGSKYLDSGSDTPIDIALVDEEGKPLTGKNLSVGIYAARWNWWYDRGYSDRYRFNSNTHLGSISKSTVITDGSGKAQFFPDTDGYGNYMIRVCDQESGHCTGDFFYTGRYWSAESDQQGASQLVFETDKESYTIGEDIVVQVPSTAESKLFVSIENGSRVLQAFWVDASADMTKISIPTDAEMNANIYIHVHLVQPHNNGLNDLPMRMYGVVPVAVVDPNSTLLPEIAAADKVEPNTDYKVTVSEQSGKPMYYTLAVVDEGLLSLTRYSTPRPWDHFYSKQALGVDTWDVYDYVLSGYGGEVDQYISIGGDAGQLSIANAKEVNRFKSVVKHIGPFALGAGQSTTHTLSMPNYVGAVRVMAVARYEDQYGSTDKTVLVKKPLMVQSTLPRVLGPGEQLSLAANVWAMEDNVKSAKVDLTTKGGVEVGEGSQQLSFTKPGDKLAIFSVTVGEAVGMATFTTTATSGSITATDKIDISIRNPNPATTEIIAKVLQPGERWTTDYTSHGVPGTNQGALEVSNIPPLNLTKRLSYLMRYPYGCLEQTTSSVFPQLYLGKLADLDASQLSKTTNNITAGIQRLKRFQLSSGGFTYWTGNQNTNSWGTSYAGHFLLEARDLGYSVPASLIKKFVDYQTTAASRNDTGDVDQAYRLYTLARAGEPHIGAMNRLRKAKDLSSTASHLLAASYALIGQQTAAESLLLGVSSDISPYRETGRTYGSDIRDMAIIALTMDKLGKKEDAIKIIANLSKGLNTDRWYSTQTTAFALLSAGQIFGSYESDDLKFTYALTGNPQAVQSNKSLYVRDINIAQSPSGNVTIENTSSTVQFAKVVLTGQRPVDASEEAKSSHLSIDVSYIDIEGNTLDPSMIKQGTDFYSVVKVRNPSTRYTQISEVALSQILPSGWEIQNDRIGGGASSEGNQLEYQDIRDDRVYSFFDLGNKQSITVKTKLTAAYAGRFYMPPVLAEAMYDHEVQASTTGQWIQVVQ